MYLPSNSVNVLFRSAFMYFSKEKRPIIKGQDDSLSIGDVAKKLGSLWKMLAPEQRTPYDELAKEDRERYLQEMEVYRRSLGGGSGSKGASKKKAAAPQKRGRKPKVVVEEEEDEDEEDEEDEEEEEESASD